MSPRAADTEPSTARGPRAGFMLLEVLVAVVVAGLTLSVLGRVLAGAWGTTRTPQDVLTAVGLARADLQAWPAARPTAAPPRGFSIVQHVEPVTIVERPSGLDPAPPVVEPAALPGQPIRNDVMPGVTQHPPAGIGASGQLQHVSVVVRTRAGRSLTFDAIRLDVPPN